ncbi:SAM-dependent methyltransferase [Nocardia grenadensis]|uniref:SAM-dependent methyltransferase n=1 Tax=Nocardia grenadensis TaxID=931537 RepID=UPI003D910FF8
MLRARFTECPLPGSTKVRNRAAGEKCGASAACRVAVSAQTREHSRNSSAQVRYRSRAEVTAFPDGFENTGPGVVPLQQWLADDLPETKLVLYGAIGRKH